MEEKRSVEERLAASLKELVIREPFEKITIRQITDGAGVIRVTFYNHFQDKYDLLEWIVREELLEPVRLLVDNGMYRETMVLIFRNLQKDADFYTAAAKIEGTNSFRDIGRRCFTQMLEEMFTRQISQKKPVHPWMTAQYLAKYYGQSMNFVAFEWIESGMKASPEEMAAIYEYIATRSMYDLLDELRN